MNVFCGCFAHGAYAFVLYCDIDMVYTVYYKAMYTAMYTIYQF